ncbi:MAG: rhodanese-like domain-containing protein [Acidobacteria bacterium]|nr:rhodanese-like domain-containing protein [Acidobacteriota bacterium]MBI3265124.1 rhodanese-like domain-containing protein [Acidobacteriota bacterium]
MSIAKTAILSAVVVAALATVAYAQPRQQFENPSSVPRLSQAEFKKLLQAGTIVVLDVRSAQSYKDAHIPGAISVPIDEVDLNVDRLKGFKKPIVTYCA